MDQAGAPYSFLFISNLFGSVTSAYEPSCRFVCLNVTMSVCLESCLVISLSHFLSLHLVFLHITFLWYNEAFLIENSNSMIQNPQSSFHFGAYCHNLNISVFFSMYVWQLKYYEYELLTECICILTRLDPSCGYITFSSTRALN